jgi:hypothetical protein
MPTPPEILNIGCAIRLVAAAQLVRGISRRISRREIIGALDLCLYLHTATHSIAARQWKALSRGVL